LTNDEHRFPLGVSAVQENIYVDDILVGIDTIKKVLIIKEQTKALLGLLQTGGFQSSK